MPPPKKSSTPSSVASSSSKGKKKGDCSPAAPPAKVLFVPEPGVKLTREQHAILRQQRAEAAAEEKKALFGSWTGKVPVTVLYEQVQKMGWDKPQVNVSKKSKGYQGSVVLSADDKKTREKIKFTYSDPTKFSATEQEAKHWAATYALHRFTSHLAIHRVLPPAHQDYWAQLESHRKELDAETQQFDYAPDPFLAVEARAKLQKEREKAAKDSKEAKARNVERRPWEEYQPVTLSNDLRAAIEELVKSAPPAPVTKGRAGGDGEDDDDDGAGKADLLASLTSKGFRSAHATEALDHCNDLTSALDWLCLHVPEDDLPAAFHSATKELQAGASTTAHLTREWSLKRMVRSGVGRDACADVFDTCGGEMEALAELFWRFGGEDGDGVGGRPTVGEDVDREELEQSWRDELEALASIFGVEGEEGGRFVRDDVRGVVRLSVDCLMPEHPMVLEVGLPAGSTYPNDVPAALVECETLPRYLRLGIMRGLATEARKLLGMPMLFSLVSWLEENATEVVENPPKLISLAGGLGVRRKEMAREMETVEAGTGKLEKKAERRTRRKRGDAEINKRGAELKAAYEAATARTEYKQWLKGRERLPSYSYRSRIIDAMAASAVLIICGETGCGKSTQTGQFILEEELSAGRGGRCNIICTQPRRISALSLAERVAQERAEKVGDSVGYVIRGDAKRGRDTLLTFCTTGVLLRMLQGDSTLEDVTHVIVDEVHERSVESDFLLVILRDLIRRRPDFKLILMSATIDSATFSKYFMNAPVLEIPGFTHPVTDIYLEEIFQKVNYIPEPAYINDRSRRAAPIKVAAPAAGAAEDDEENGSGALVVAADPKELLRVRQTYESMSIDPMAIRVLMRSLKPATLDPIDYRLIAAIVRWICDNGNDGAVLVFLQGAMEIQRCIDAIRAEDLARQLEVYPLHANLSPREQSAVFRRPRKGCRKVVVATNVAETSITIDDVVFVIDAGRVKEMRHEGTTLALTETLASRASCKQRRGRAGRVRPGMCFKLFSRRFEEERMPAMAVPEILRVPLEQLCLSLKAMGVLDVGGFLSKAIDPPPAVNVEKAVSVLRTLSAISEETGDLTALGRHMATIPADLRIAKMLIRFSFGAIFHCLDPILTIAALMSTKSPFLSPPDRRDEARAARIKFARDKSDWLTDAAAFDAWREITGSNGKARDFCEVNFISSGAMTAVSDLREQYLDILADIGLVADRRAINGGVSSVNALLVKSVIVAGLYPQLARVREPEDRWVGTAHGAVVREAEAREIRFWVDGGRDGGGEEEVWIHPASVNADVGKWEDLFHQKVATSKVFLRDSTMVSPWAVLMFGGKLTVDHEGRTVEVDGFSKFQAFPRIAVLTNGLRRLLDEALRLKIEDPGLDIMKMPVGDMLLKLLTS
ncbi:hypothetical protein HK101_003398 [Irineochytrium annulatum]|nr:hypothetical protein HK101_003398 [Irineochytrium annulatum]